MRWFKTSRLQLLSWPLSPETSEHDLNGVDFLHRRGPRGGPGEPVVCRPSARRFAGISLARSVLGPFRGSHRFPHPRPATSDVACALTFLIRASRVWSLCKCPEGCNAWKAEQCSSRGPRKSSNLRESLQKHLALKKQEDSDMLKACFKKLPQLSCSRESLAGLRPASGL